MNLAEARTELGARGFDYLSAGRMNFMLQRALVDFEDTYTWPWLKETVTGAAPLAIADLKYVRSVYDDRQNEMFGIDDDDDIYIDQVGTPQNWWIDDTGTDPTLKVWPVGDATLTVAYYATDSTISADSDTPRMPARYHGTWIDLAVVRAYHDSDNFAAAQALRQQIAADLQSMIVQYETRNRMNSQYIRILAGSEDD